MASLAFLLLAAFAIRLPHFGNPAFDIDEEFYLVVGHRLLSGELPFADIWDRKPIGLFLIYALADLIGGGSVYAYQILAALFAGGTAWTICRIARPVAGSFGGLASGLLYLLWIETVGGGGGQAPIFYNLPVAIAAALTFRALEETDHARFGRLGFGAMIAIGIAIQIKYTALFEGAYFGLLLAWRVLREEAIPSAAMRISALALTALAPTVAALIVYAAIGQLQAFWFANFVSIFLRAKDDVAELHHRLGQIGAHLIPLAACALASIWELRADSRTNVRRWQWRLAGWLTAAIAGFLSVGAFYFHYALPLFVPLTIAAAPIFRRRPFGYAIAGVAAWLPFENLEYPDFSTTRYWQQKTDALQALIPPQVTTGCMQMFAGPPILYLRTHACTVTRYIFPAHLTSAIETHAVGTNTSAEIRRIMAARPLVLVTNDVEPKLDPRSYALLRTLRDRSYSRAGRVVMEDRPIDVWVRRP